MARVTSQRAAEAIGNRYDMILIAALRARELKKKYKSKIPAGNDVVVTALREIEEGMIGRDYLKRVFVRK
jgi:DNA-directed RNA polymerase subunit omega